MNKFKTTIGIVVALVLLLSGTVCCSAGGKKFSENINRSLFSDRRAYQVGDVVTILIVEYSMGSHEAGTETNSQNDLGLTAAGGGDLSDINYGLTGQWKNKHEGTGETRRGTNLQGTLAARIVEITESGNLVIEGTREVVINGEKQHTTLRGVVRPEDISGQNTVFSYNVADAQIGYTGKGEINTAAKPGFFTRILNWIF
jgi:flagellar L-ring protein precursor FlgH